MPQIKNGHNFGPYSLTERGGGMCPRKKRQDAVTVGHTNKKFFFGFFSISFRKEDGPLMLKKIFLILPPTPPPWGGVKVKKFRFLGFTKYPKVLQHRVIAR